MQIDRILYPVSSLGPGERLVIWTIGCSKKCFNCANPELWENNPDKNINVTELVELIRQYINKNKIDGITITGGEPLDQIEELNELLLLIREIADDILVFTGYSIEEAIARIPEHKWEILKNHVSVLIDGPYINKLNDNNHSLLGSTNQNIIYFDETKKESYSIYIKKGRTVQNVFYNEKIISVGIHNRDI